MGRHCFEFFEVLGICGTHFLRLRMRVIAFADAFAGADGC